MENRVTDLYINFFNGRPQKEKETLNLLYKKIKTVRDRFSLLSKDINVTPYVENEKEFDTDMFIVECLLDLENAYLASQGYKTLQML